MIINLDLVRQYKLSADGCDAEALRHKGRTARQLRAFAALQRQRAAECASGRRSA